MGTTDAAWPADVEFVEYVRARQHTLLRGAYLVCADLQLAEQLLEAALVTLARHWDEVRDEQPDLEVRRVLYRGAVSSWGRRAHDPGVEAVRDEAAIADDEAQPAETVDTDEAVQRRDVLHALDGLTPLQRAAVVLRHLDDRTERDTAQILGVPVATVARETEAAVARLRVALPRVDLETGWTR